MTTWHVHSYYVAHILGRAFKQQYSFKSYQTINVFALFSRIRTWQLSHLHTTVARVFLAVFLSIKLPV